MFDFDIKKKLEILEFAEKLDDVTETARLSVVSRAISYRHHKLIKESEGQALNKQILTDQAIAIASSNLLWTIRT